jgi:hypothetical protein
MNDAHTAAASTPRTCAATITVMKNVAVLETAACRAGKLYLPTVGSPAAGESPPSCLPVVQPNAVSLRRACTAGSTHCNMLLTVHDEHVGHSCAWPMHHASGIAYRCIVAGTDVG